MPLRVAIVDKEDGEGARTIYINKKPIRVTGSALSRDAILTAGGYNLAQYSLYSMPGSAGPQGQPGGGAELQGPTRRILEIKEGQTVEIYDGIHFNAILQDVPYG